MSKSNQFKVHKLYIESLIKFEVIDVKLNDFAT